MPGVERRRLDRLDAQTERVTTIVRYAPGSAFSSHVHGGGEEFIVLEGVFQDDYGDWPAGSYVRNPPTSEHTPRSDDGCIIMVKLEQFDPDDRQFIHANRHRLGAVEDASRPGVRVSPLYQDTQENVCFEYWQAGSRVRVTSEFGAEVLVLAGEFSESGETLGKHAWLRVPVGYTIDAIAGESGAQLWIKRDHLRGL